MEDPSKALPKISETSIRALLEEINLHRVRNVEILQTGAAFHVIALLQFHDHDDAILRIAGPHIPALKTENEVAVITWLQQCTTIPVPSMIYYDSGTDNALGCEYTIQARLQGHSLDTIWSHLSDAEHLHILDVVANCLQQLNAHTWDHISSLRMDSHHPGTFLPAPLLDERFWFHPDMETYFPGETYASLNPTGPYTSYVEFSIARLQKYTHCIRVHPSLEYMRSRLPLIERFIAAIRDASDDLNRNTVLRLAHRDLHLGNIMYDPVRNEVTGILDWEFSTVMPLQQGDLSRAILHDLGQDAGARGRKEERLERMRGRCEGRGVDVLGSYDYTSEDQEEMQTAVDLLRSIVEVSPRGQRAVEKLQWEKDLVEIMEEWVKDDIAV